VRSLDTNILVRVVVKDDPDQTLAAATVFKGPVFIAHSVIMETEWVLRSRYKMPRPEIAAALTRLLDVETVRTAEPDLVAWSLGRYVAGGDLADLLHLVASRGLESFLTLDGKLAEAAGPASPVAVERLA